MSAEPAAPPKLKAGEVILKLRDEVLQLVHAYNQVGEYKDAASAQAFAVALTEFENSHILTDMEWPPRVETDGEYKRIALVE